MFEPAAKRPRGTLLAQVSTAHGCPALAMDRLQRLKVMLAPSLMRLITSCGPGVERGERIEQRYGARRNGGDEGMIPLRVLS
jgi:hypothetical protein